MIKEAIEILSQKDNLTPEMMTGVLEEILSGKVETDTIAEFLSLLEDKGATAEELTAAVLVMRRYAEKIEVEEEVLDTCGTGGDAKFTFNISTLSALVASGAGVKVAKHGNRSVSSKCGSADLLEALGVDINMSKEKVKRCLKELGIAFFFAPNFHPAIKQVMPARKKLGRKTIFNLLGPLLNPAGAKRQLIGLFAKELLLILAEVLRNLGCRHALLVCGADGLDEVTTTDITFVVEYKDNKIKQYRIEPEDFGLKRARLEDLVCKDLSDSVKIAQEVLQGKGGPHRDIVLLNSACAIYVGGIASSLKEAWDLAVCSLDSGSAYGKLNMLINFSKGL